MQIFKKSLMADFGSASGRNYDGDRRFENDASNEPSSTSIGNSHAVTHSMNDVFEFFARDQRKDHARIRID